MRKLHPSFKKHCLCCKGGFKAYVCNIKKGGAKFCSMTCYLKYPKEKNPEKIKRTAKERFDINTDKGSKKSDCWVWNGLKNKGGYGRMRIDNKDWTSHRYSWSIHFGEIPHGLLVCHKCDNRACVNPNHLFLGTHSDNAIDMVSKGRNRDDKGSKHPMAKLNEKQVIDIRSKIDSGIMQKDLAEFYCISRGVISQIHRRVKWVHI